MVRYEDEDKELKASLRAVCTVSTEKVFGCDSSPRSPNVIVCLSVTLATTVLKLKTVNVFRLWTLGLLKDFGLYALCCIVYKIY